MGAKRIGFEIINEHLGLRIEVSVAPHMTGHIDGVVQNRRRMVDRFQVSIWLVASCDAFQEVMDVKVGDVAVFVERPLAIDVEICHTMDWIRRTTQTNRLSFSSVRVFPLRSQGEGTGVPWSQRVDRRRIRFP